MAEKISNDGTSQSNVAEGTSRFIQLHTAYVGFIKRFFNRLISQCIAFKNKIEHLALRIMMSHEWEVSKVTMTFFRNKIQLFKKKKECLEIIRSDKSQAKSRLDDLQDLMKEKDVKGLEKLDFLLEVTDISKKLVKERLRSNIPTAQANQEEIKARLNFVNLNIKPFKIMTEKVEEISNRKLALQKAIIEQEEQDFELKWDLLTRELSDAKIAAEKLYKENNLIELSRALYSWSQSIYDRPIVLGVTKDEREFEEGLLLFIDIEKENIEKIKMGDPSSLRLMATPIEFNADRDLNLYRSNHKNLTTKLLDAKIKDLETNMRAVTKELNTYVRSIKDLFQVDELKEL